MKSEKGREEDGGKVKHVDSPECSRNLGVGAAAMQGKGVKTQFQLKRGNYYSKPMALSTRCFFRARSTISSVVGGGGGSCLRGSQQADSEMEPFAGG